MGKASRDKGARGERSLCLHLNLLGYNASRVIRTRAVKGIENDVVPDVIANIDGIEETFESKVRKCSFQTIYRVYEKYREGNVYRFALGSGGPYVSVGSDLMEVRKCQDVHFRNLTLDALREVKTHQRILSLRSLLKGAGVLAIKDNNCYWLFLRFWA